MIKKFLLVVATLPVIAGGCKKCVECEIRLKQSQDVIGHVDEYCGTKKKVDAKEEELASEYNCIECSVNTGGGTANSGVHCGNRAFTDSIETAWENGALQSGNTAVCIYHRDTANVTCLLK